MARSRSVEGRVVLVTGAARGIGAGLARTLAGRGAKVALVGLEPEELAARAAECGPDAGWWRADGIAARKAHIMYPNYLWFAFATRATTPLVAARVGRRVARLAERVAAADPDEYRGLTGPGGRADSRSSGQPSQ